MTAFKGTLLRILCSLVSYFLTALLRVAHFVNTGIFRNKPLYDPLEDGDPSNDDQSQPNYDPDPRPPSYHDIVNGCHIITVIIIGSLLLFALVLILQYVVRPFTLITNIVATVAELKKERLRVQSMDVRIATAEIYTKMDGGSSVPTGALKTLNRHKRHMHLF